MIRKDKTTQDNNNDNGKDNAEDEDMDEEENEIILRMKKNKTRYFDNMTLLTSSFSIEHITEGNETS